MQTALFSLIFILCMKVPITFASNEKYYRLPNANIVVNAYTLRIVPYLKNDFNFDGKVIVEVRILEEMKCITMNMKDLIIQEISAKDTQKSYQVFHQLLHEKEMLQICISETLSRYTTIEISISFTGKMRDDFKGLYKLQYDDNGSKKWIAAALLEPTYARMVFPCFDEPQYKARFSLSVARYSDEISSSVTNVQSTSEKDSKIDNRVWDTFQKTVPCPPYLMAFTVHSFISCTKLSGRLSVCSRKHTEKDVDFVMSSYTQWFKAIVEYLNTYGYFYEYLDLVAVPDGDEFSQKATMMIYKEKDILQIEGVDTEKHKEEIAKASIHKIYHLWMGGYVRPHWWSDTWLSESLGIYFQYMISAEVHPVWEMGNRFITEVLEEALFEEEMYPDAILSSPTKSPNEIQSQKFNSLINKKGASIITMLEDVVGSDNLKKAFRKVVHKTHDDKVEIQPNDLWDEIDREIKGKNILPDKILVKNFMQTWFLSSNYPLITVLTDENHNVVLKQEMYRGPITTNEIPDYFWIIPITCKKKPIPNQKYLETWLHNCTPVVTNYHINAQEWVLCNSKRGYYRVTYSKEKWLLLIEQLKSQLDKIDTLSRARLIDDSFHLAIYNKLPFSIAFNLGTYLEKESDMLPWFSLMKYITYFLRFYEETDVKDYLKRYFLGIIKYQYNRIGYEERKEDSYVEKTGRPFILALACQLGLTDCLDNSARIYNTFKNDLSKIPAELKYVVYCSSFETSKDKEETWNRLWEIYKYSQIMSEKELVLSSLACVNDVTIFKKYLETTVNSNQSEMFYFEKECIIKSCAKYYKGVTATLQLIDEMIPKLRFQSQQTNNTLIMMANEIHFNVDSSEHVEKLKQLVMRLENYGDKNTQLSQELKKSAELGSKKIDYKIKNGDEIKQAIHDITGYTPPTTTTRLTTTDTSKVTTTRPTNSSEVPSSSCIMASSTIKYLIVIIGLMLAIM